MAGDLKVGDDKVCFLKRKKEVFKLKLKLKFKTEGFSYIIHHLAHQAFRFFALADGAAVLCRRRHHSQVEAEVSKLGYFIQKMGKEARQSVCSRVVRLRGGGEKQEFRKKR